MSSFWRRVALSGVFVGVGVVLGLTLMPVPSTGRVTTRSTSELCAQSPRPPSAVGAVDLLAHNSLVIANLMLGVLTLGIKTAWQLMYFGIESQAVYRLAVLSTNSVGFAVAALLPHGVFEVAAFVSAGATALGGARLFWQILRRTNVEIRAGLRWLATECVAAFALLILAATIEEWVTPWMMRWALGCQ